MSSNILPINRNDVLAEKQFDAAIPGFQAECYPDEAEDMGAFEEAALSEEDAADAAADGLL